MAQKKAFVRYAQNKAVPGSLIVRTKAPKVGTWKEVPYDICCGGGCPQRVYNPFVTFELQENLFTTEFAEVQMYWACSNMLPGINSATSLYTLNTPTAPNNFSFSNWDDVINFLNTHFSVLGVFSYLGGINVQVITTPSANEYIGCNDALFYLEFFTP
jgi:hypothetical protein